MTPRRARAGWRALAAATALALGVTACADNGPHAVTSDEATRLADMLYTLWESGGMSFELTSQPAPGVSTHLVGEVDYTQGIGYATVTSTGADAPVDAVIFTDVAVLEHLPDLVAYNDSLGVDRFTWVSRPLDPTSYDLDGLLGLLAGLATERRDNPELIQQGGATWLRSAELRGMTVDVFEYSEQARFWVEAGTSRLVRFEGNNTALTRPIVIDVLELGPVEPPDPAADEVIDYADLGDLYQAYRTASS